MTVYLDSGAPDDIREAVDLGLIRGVTTNPALLRRVTDDPLRHCSGLLDKFEGLRFFYQPSGAYGDPEAEAWTAWRLDPQRVTVKLMSTRAGAAMARRLVDAGASVALTAAQSANAMILAETIGCGAVIPYVDRAWRDQRTETHLVRSLSAVRRAKTLIVAASVKNVGQCVQAYLDGADAVTAPLEVLRALLLDPAALEAEKEFAAAYSGAVLPMP